LNFWLEKTDTKQLPCISFCVVQGFKSLTNVTNEESYKSDTFSLEEIFFEATVNRFRNKSAYDLYETDSFLLGRCHTVCSLDRWQKRTGPTLLVRNNTDLKLFVHSGISVIKRFCVFVVTL